MPHPLLKDITKTECISPKYNNLKQEILWNCDNEVNIRNFNVATLKSQACMTTHTEREMRYLTRSPTELYCNEATYYMKELDLHYYVSY